MASFFDKLKSQLDMWDGGKTWSSVERDDRNRQQYGVQTRGARPGNAQVMQARPQNNIGGVMNAPQPQERKISIAPARSTNLLFNGNRYQNQSRIGAPSNDRIGYKDPWLMKTGRGLLHGELGGFNKALSGGLDLQRSANQTVQSNRLLKGISNLTPGGAFLNSSIGQKGFDATNRAGIRITDNAQGVIDRNYGKKAGYGKDYDYASAVGDFGGQIALGLMSGGAKQGISKLASGTVVPSVAMGARTYGDTFRNNQTQGKSFEESRNRAAGNAVISAGLEKFGLDNVMGPAGTNVAKNLGRRFLAEGSTEGAQQFVDNAANSRGLTEGVVESAILGGILGGGAGAGFDLANPNVRNQLKQDLSRAKQVAQDANTPKEVRLNLKDQDTLMGLSDFISGEYNASGSERNALLADARRVGAKHKVDLINGSANERMDRIAELLDRIHMQNKQLKQEGFVRIPGGDKSPASDLSSEQTEFINDYAEMLQGMGEGNGVAILEDGRRVSNNARDAETAGRNMTKQDWFDKARQDIESGKAGFGASDDYKAIPGRQDGQKETRTGSKTEQEGTQGISSEGSVAPETRTNKTWKQVSDEQMMERALRQDYERSKTATPLTETELQSVKSLSDEYIEKLRNSKSLAEAKKLNKEYMDATSEFEDGTRVVSSDFNNMVNSVDDAYMAVRKAHNQATQPTKGANARIETSLSRLGETSQPQRNSMPQYQTPELQTQGQLPTQGESQLPQPAQKPSSDVTVPDVDAFVNEQAQLQNPKKKLDLKGQKNTFLRKWVDSLAPAESLFKDAVKDGKISQETLDEIIVKNGKSLRAGTMGNFALQDSGVVEMVNGLSKQDYDTLGQVLIAVHSKDLRANNVETGRDADIDQKLIDTYSKQYEPQIKQFRKVSNYVLDQAVEAQLISKETAKLLRQKYPNYVPMHRVMEDLETYGSFGNKQVANLGRQTVVKKIKGSKRTVENPLESMITKVQDLSAQKLRNEAALTWIDTLKEIGEAQPLKGTKKPDQSTMSVFRNGVKETYIVSPELEAAAKGLTRQQMGPITNLARKFTRVFKTGTTGLNVPFVVTNLARDQQTAFTNMQRGEAEVFSAIPQTIMETLGHGKLYQEAVRQGAISTSFDLTKPGKKQTAENIRIKGTKQGVLNKIEDAIGRSEEYTRLQQYIATKDYWIKKGLNEEQARNKATVAAQQNSADFARSGDIGQILNAWLPYTNAGLQGTRAYIRSATTNPGRYAVKAGATLVMPAIMTALWNTSDEERKKIYEDISPFEKETSFVIVTPWAQKNEEGIWQGIIKIPKPPGISSLIYPVEKGVASMSDLDPVSFGDITSAVLGFASPVGESLNSGISTITPQILKPGIETVINRNLFTGRDVVPYWLKNKEPSEQKYSDTSGTAGLLAKPGNTSPLNAEHLIKGYFGELGLQGLNAADNAFNKLGLIPEEQIGGRSIARGLSRRFTEAYDSPDSKIANAGGTPKAGQSTRSVDDAVEGIKQSFGGKYAGYSEKELDELGKTDADAKVYLRNLQGVRKADDMPQDMPDNLNEQAKKILIKRERLNDEGKVKWLSRKADDKNLTSTLHGWLPKDVTKPPVTNETAIDWANFEKKKATGTLGKLEEQTEMKSILRGAYNSQLNEDERDLYQLSKDNLWNAYESGLITDENLSKAVEVEKQLFDAGLISTEKLQKKLGLVARGYKGRSGGRGGKGRKGGKGPAIKKPGALSTVKILKAMQQGSPTPKQVKINPNSITAKGNIKLKKSSGKRKGVKINP